MRLLVIALDGLPATWLERSKLKSVFNEDSYVSGTLKSTIPFGTPVAWPAFITGIEPSATTNFGFYKRSTRNPLDTGEIMTAHDLKGESLWKKLSSAGFMVGVFGVPMTYPPEQVNGFLISGLLLPRGEGCTYPSSLFEILRMYGHDPSDIAGTAIDNSRQSKMRFREELERRLSARLRAAWGLLSKYDLDFYMVHIFESDRAFHEFLNDDEILIDEFLSSLRSELASFVEKVEERYPECKTLVISDHGLAHSKHYFMIDTWLLRNGYISLKRSIGTRIRYLLFRIGITPQNGVRILPKRITGPTFSDLSEFKMTPSHVERPSLPTRLFRAVALDKKRDVDWERSLAHSYRGEGIAMIYVRDGTSQAIAEIRQKLATELDVCMTGEDAYGSRNGLIPDIVAWDSSIEFAVLSNQRFFTSGKVRVRKYGYDEASHTPDGVMISPKSIGLVERIVDAHGLILRYFGIKEQ